MIDIKYVVKVACIWVTILYVICFVGIALFSPLRPLFMEYALHTRMDLGVSTISFVTFIAGLFFWNIITALGVALYCYLYNSIKRHKDTKNDPFITMLAVLIIGIMIGYLVAFVGGSDGRYEGVRTSGSFMKERGSSMMQMGKKMMDGGMMMRQKGQAHSDDEMMQKGREWEEDGVRADEEARDMMKRGENLMQLMK